MIKKANLQSVDVGTTVEMYPRDAWSRIPSEVNMEKLWNLVGPQVDMHIRKLPLWKVFCVVYFEGLAHGSQAVKKESA